jgi:hypothetical protein
MSTDPVSGMKVTTKGMAIPTPSTIINPSARVLVFG